MSVLTQREIVCDECGVRYPIPKGTSNGEMRVEMRKRGWNCRRWTWHNGKRVRQIDQCVACAVMNRMRAK
jgi:hypothetical protein